MVAGVEIPEGWPFQDGRNRPSGFDRPVIVANISLIRGFVSRAFSGGYRKVGLRVRAFSPASARKVCSDEVL